MEPQIRLDKPNSKAYARKSREEFRVPGNEMHDAKCGCEQFLEKGLEFMTTSSWEKAKVCYETAVAIHADNETAWGNLGSCHLNLGDLNKAMECLGKAIKINPFEKHVIVNIGIVNAKGGRFKEALKCFEMALRIDPHLQVAQSNRAQALRDIQESGPAQKTTSKDLKIAKRGDKFVLLAGEEPIKTPGGKLVGVETKALLEAIVSDFEGQGDLLIENGVIMKPRVFSAYTMISTKLDFLDGGQDLAPDLPGWLSRDPMFAATAGHPIISMFQSAQREKTKVFFQEHGLKLKTLEQYEPGELEEVVAVLAKAVAGLSPAQKSVLINLAWPNDAQFVVTIQYLLGRYTAREWAMAVFSRTDDVCALIGDKPVGGIFSIPSDMADEDRDERIESLLADYESQCAIAARFLEAAAA